MAAGLPLFFLLPFVGAGMLLLLLLKRWSAPFQIKDADYCACLEDIWEWLHEEGGGASHTRARTARVSAEHKAEVLCWK